ncbi:cell division ATP-binding protein FtsE [Caldicellulosiruptoraceae bacterium PP1]
MLQFKNVSKIYSNGVAALKDVNLTINKGEFAFIVGSSGAGKSTLIKLLLKEIDPTDGEIFVGEYNLNNLKQKEIPYYRRKIGIVFQDFRLLPNKTVYENVAFAMQITESPHKLIRRQVPYILSLVGLLSKSKCYPHQLSGGEQQRVALARAIINRPNILIADEPTGNLDPDTSWEIMNLLEDINKRGTTVIVATHAKEIVNQMKKRVIAIDKGIIVKDQERGVYEYESPDLQVLSSRWI